jgi:hypothetical protein
VCGKQ